MASVVPAKKRPLIIPPPFWLTTYAPKIPRQKSKLRTEPRTPPRQALWPPVSFASFGPSIPSVFLDSVPAVLLWPAQLSCAPKFVWICSLPPSPLWNRKCLQAPLPRLPSLACTLSRLAPATVAGYKFPQNPSARFHRLPAVSWQGHQAFAEA